METARFSISWHPPETLHDAKIENNLNSVAKIQLVVSNFLDGILNS